MAAVAVAVVVVVVVLSVSVLAINQDRVGRLEIRRNIGIIENCPDFNIAFQYGVTVN